MALSIQDMILARDFFSDYIFTKNRSFRYHHEILYQMNPPEFIKFAQI
jgi:hypothetical protein